MENRPECIECGSENVISKGVSWLCKDCGRWFLKKKRHLGLAMMESLGKEIRPLWIHSNSWCNPKLQGNLFMFIDYIIHERKDIVEKYNLYRRDPETLSTIFWQAINIESYKRGEL